MGFPYKVDQNSLVFPIPAKVTFENKRFLTLRKDSLVLILEKGYKEVYSKEN